MCYACLRALSSLSKASSATQVHRDWGVVEASGGIRGVIALEAVLVILLLSLFWDESAHLVVVSLSEDLVYGLLRNDADTLTCRYTRGKRHDQNLRVREAISQPVRRRRCARSLSDKVSA